MCASSGSNGGISITVNAVIDAWRSAASRQATSIARSDSGLPTIGTSSLW
jgi:hypothetical protein